MGFEILSIVCEMQTRRVFKRLKVNQNGQLVSPYYPGFLYDRTEMEAEHPKTYELHQYASNGLLHAYTVKEAARQSMFLRGVLVAAHTVLNQPVYSDLTGTAIATPKLWFDCIDRQTGRLMLDHPDVLEIEDEAQRLLDTNGTLYKEFVSLLEKTDSYTAPEARLIQVFRNYWLKAVANESRLILIQLPHEAPGTRFTFVDLHEPQILGYLNRWSDNRLWTFKATDNLEPLFDEIERAGYMFLPART